MLPRAHRMNDGDAFRLAIRRGVRGTSPSVVVHVGPTPEPAGATTSVGFVVSKAVGNAVTRNRVKRRLRHLMRERVAAVPSGSLVVVRALPAAVSTSALADELDVALSHAVRRLGSRQP